MDEYFRIVISPDQMTAFIDLNEELPTDFTVTPTALISFLAKYKVIHGINDYVISKITTNPQEMNYPVVVAKGTPAKDGVDAYLVNEVQTSTEESVIKFNFRNVLKIPSVKSGQLLASIVSATTGSEGKDVTGKQIPAKSGKPLKIRPGKNVIFNVSQFFATSDGEISITNKQISVNPVFEVKGNLDLKVGNIDFIGNVVIRGNVPSGYVIKCGGDVKISGLVEGAIILADGNVYISGGVTGGNKGKIVAKGNIQANFLNQANVYAGQNIYIQKSVLHSKVEAVASIYCNLGLVIGGEMFAGQDIHVKEAGSRTYTKTILQAGFDKVLLEREQELQIQKNSIYENLEKLTQLEQQLVKIEQTTKKLTEEQKIILIKQRSTKNILGQQLDSIEEEVFQLELEKKEKPASKIYFYDRVHPNVTLQFNKYIKQIQIVHQRSVFYFKNGEIEFEPIV